MEFPVAKKMPPVEDAARPLPDIQMVDKKKLLVDDAARLLSRWFAASGVSVLAFQPRTQPRDTFA